MAGGLAAALLRLTERNKPSLIHPSVTTPTTTLILNIGVALCLTTDQATPRPIYQASFLP